MAPAGVVRFPKPAFHPSAIVRQRSAKHVAMLVKPSRVGAAVRNEQPRGNGPWTPLARGGDLGSQPDLPIEGPKHLRDIDDLGLELDNEEGASPGMPGEGVDHASFAVDRERHLRRELPVTNPREPSGEGLMERGMARVHDPIELAAAPAKGVVGPGVERQRGGHDLRHRQAIREAALDPRDVGFRHARARRQLGLRPTDADPQRSKRGPEPMGVHEVEDDRDGLPAAHLATWRPCHRA